MLYLVIAYIVFIFWFGWKIHRTPISNTWDDMPTKAEDLVD